MNRVSDRNHSAQYYVNSRLGVAKTKTAADFPDFGPKSEIQKLMTDLIEVKSKGFRGIVITALAGMHLDEAYDPLTNFYGCNPRSIFEQGIWYALREHNIPSGLSDPLNVAKNTNALNEDWAQGRRPQSAALAVVSFLRMVRDASKAKRARLIDYFFFRLWSHAHAIGSIRIATVESSSESRQSLINKLITFSLDFPEYGAIPQLLVSQLLRAVYLSSSVEVNGGDESVFGTNTTSKKPADIWLSRENSPFVLFEVTVKPVSRKRLDDCISSLSATGHIELPVTFICRLDADVSALEMINGSCNYGGKRFDFVDYSSFCQSLAALISEVNLTIVTGNLTTAIQDSQVSIKTKEGWNKIFSAQE